MSFCTAFTNGRCCIPIHDEYIKDTFYSILSAGSICAAAPNAALVTLKAIQCTACNPAVSLYLSTPRNVSFFSAPQTLKVCAAAAAAVSPHRFNDCGLVYIGSRNSICLPNIPIAPSIVFPGCDDGDHVCYSTTKGDYSPIWYCSKTPCGVDTPLGFRDVACHGPSCTASFQFLNDNRGAKPPFFEMFPVEIIDETSCDDAAICCVTDPRLEAST
ncbi:hypothetical protein SPRG_10730 [Saprolegnia parasitica CBS 223.65]|uniref:Uncharacterized protein n=1 Tax=Saprolegnia parasitica (strain CBS 223.65) TaxID=695850 RepID=A0A067C9N6_SAPPC|nr:hypothetical protein SPRG_10730 [Saprolegnia parasitica CBS 223.65]KDO23537.1 hypothetical protein SPRG_10730 [Saprolegnia parasitica CBS 223.65]|eukprot:XP_012205688.1 hypothetical protein SPRG_10730 [Saprolegnia parasitica CBS 223.65]